MRLLVLPLVLALALSACSMAPTLVKPAMPVPTAYTAAAAADQHANAADLGWRTMFGDRRLQRLIEIALDNNRDLRLAALNVDAA
ncbi:RND transporter, partial [Burkholderia pyrrocinia]|nr:RND transporter [Burkholderia pyrrocinia]